MPKKSVPILTLVDQSNLWSGQQLNSSGSWTNSDESTQQTLPNIVHRPKANRNGVVITSQQPIIKSNTGNNNKQRQPQHQHSESLDHSIAV